MLSLFRLRGLVYTLVGTLVLSTLWVTSLVQLTARPAATDLLTEVGAQVLNPFLVGQKLGMSEQNYGTLEAAARAHPAQPLSLLGLKVRVLGSEIVGRSYADATHVVYRHVAGAYYDGGAQAVFAVPSQLQSALSTFALFNPSNLQQLPQSVAGQSLPQVPHLPQIPSFVQPLFTVTGLTPDTFTATGHARLLGLLPFFWLALIIWMALTAVFDRSGNRFRALLRGAVHGTWPVVALLAALWVLSRVYPAKFAPYEGLLGIVSRTVLLFYGGALAFGVLALVLLWAARRRQPAAAQSPSMAMAGVPAMRGQAGAQMQQAMQAMQSMQAMPQMQGKADMPQMPHGWNEPPPPQPVQAPQTLPGWGQPGVRQMPQAAQGPQASQMPMGWQQPQAPQPPQPPQPPQGWQQPTGQSDWQTDWQQPQWKPTEQAGQQPDMPQSPQAVQGSQHSQGPASLHVPQMPQMPQMPEVPAEWEQPGWRQPPGTGTDTGGDER
jgi:hypothetical protein